MKGNGVESLCESLNARSLGGSKISGCFAKAPPREQPINQPRSKREGTEAKLVFNHVNHHKVDLRKLRHIVYSTSLIHMIFSLAKAFSETASTDKQPDNVSGGLDTA